MKTKIYKGCIHKWKIIDTGINSFGFIFKKKIKMYTLQCENCGEIINRSGTDYTDEEKENGNN